MHSKSVAFLIRFQCVLSLLPVRSQYASSSIPVVISSDLVVLTCLIECRVSFQVGRVYCSTSSDILKQATFWIINCFLHESVPLISLRIFVRINFISFGTY